MQTQLNQTVCRYLETLGIPKEKLIDRTDDVVAAMFEMALKIQENRAKGFTPPSFPTQANDSIDLRFAPSVQNLPQFRTIRSFI